MIERYSRKEMSDLWSEDAKFAAWGQVERAHLETLVASGQCPSQALDDFDRAIRHKTVADFQRREQETAHDVIAYIAEIGEEMGADTGPFLHRGLTSSDVLDTALALRMGEALGLIESGLKNWMNALAMQAFTHARTVTIGRTHGIHAEPLAFGQILASYFAECSRAQHSLLDATTQCQFAKLSGAVGAYTQLTPGFEKQVLLKLGLMPEDVATQVIPRDRHLRVARALEDVTLAVERFALNIRHLARTEVGEVLEPFGHRQKGSSAMPHKKNPVLAENLCGLARMVRAQTSALSQNTALWHERDISHSSVERMALPDAFVLCDFLLHRVTQLTEKLDVSPAAMKKNIDLTGGLWASGTVLTKLVEAGMPRTQAYELIQSIALPLGTKVRESRVAPDAFLTALKENPSVSRVIPTETLRSIFDTERFLASAVPTFQRVFGVTPEALEWAPGTPFPSAQIPNLRRKYAVTVHLQQDVLDTESKTIQADLAHHIPSLVAVRQARTFVIDIAEEAAGQTSTSGRNNPAKAAVQNYAMRVLHNSVMEEFEVEVIQ
jgi:adenylosuccinate lyase